MVLRDFLGGWNMAGKYDLQRDIWVEIVRLREQQATPLRF